MRAKDKKVLNISLSIIIALGLTACGGGGGNGSGSSIAGGSGSDNGGSGDGAGSGGCVTFPRVKVGQIVKTKITDGKGEEAPFISGFTEEIIAVSDTATTVRLDGSPVLIDITREYTIANNFQDLTKETEELLGQKYVTTYTPFQRLPIDKVCEGQTWTSVYTEKSDEEGIVNHSQSFTIEAVNVSKTTAAGTFNTFRLKSEDIGIGGTYWIDIDSGHTVFNEFSTTSGNISGSIELIEKNF